MTPGARCVGVTLGENTAHDSTFNYMSSVAASEK